MTKVILASDNHGNLANLKKLLALENDAAYYLHCGDSCMDEDEIRPFISVSGNVDYFNFPMQRTIAIEGHSILMLHGHKYISAYSSFDPLVKLAKENNSQFVFFGHIHRFVDETIDGVRLINPGSLSYNRDESPECYARIIFDKDEVKVERINL